VVTISSRQRNKIIEIADRKIVDPRAIPDGYKCTDLIRDIYSEVGLSLDFNDYPALSFEDIHKRKFVGYPLFLRRKATTSPKRITHIGIIMDDHVLLHCSRWMGASRSCYCTYLSYFEDVFGIYDFVDPPA
jgi:hypothetical protein